MRCHAAASGSLADRQDELGTRHSERVLPALQYDADVIDEVPASRVALADDGDMSLHNEQETGQMRLEPELALEVALDGATLSQAATSAVIDEGCCPTTLL
jgi:hypothetical protein